MTGTYHLLASLVGDARVVRLEDHVTDGRGRLAHHLPHDGRQLAVLDLSLLGPGCEVTSLTIQPIVGECWRVVSSSHGRRSRVAYTASREYPRLCDRCIVRVSCTEHSCA